MGFAATDLTFEHVHRTVVAIDYYWRPSVLFVISRWSSILERTSESPCHVGDRKMVGASLIDCDTASENCKSSETKVCYHVSLSNITAAT